MGRPTPSDDRTSDRRDLLEPDVPVPARHSTARSVEQRLDTEEDLAAQKADEDSYPASDAPAW